jgi:hypothetical protein
MPMSWRDDANIDDNTRAVLEALESSRWDYRTIGGLAKATGLPANTVRAIVENTPDYIGESEEPNENGRRLFYLISPGRGVRRFLGRLRKFIP